MMNYNDWGGGWGGGWGNMMGGGYGFMWLMVIVWTIVGILAIVWLWKNIRKK